MDICLLNRISENADGPAIILITSDRDENIATEVCNQLKKSTKNEFVLFELKVSDWDSYLTPWPMKMSNRYFSGKADILLNIIETDIVPQIRTIVGINNKIYIAGYSLAGLFSLWSIYESNCFSGAVSCSGSLWYDNWQEFISSKAPRENVKVYLSLGDKEKNSKNEFMKTVEEKTLLQKLLLEKSEEVTNFCFELNEGGHFNNIKERISKGIRFVI